MPATNARVLAERRESRARFVRATPDQRGSVGRDVGEASGNSVTSCGAWPNCMARKMDAISDEKLTNTKNARKAISHRVIDRGNSAARKFSGRAIEASRPPSFPEMSLASTSKEPGRGREVAPGRLIFRHRSSEIPATRLLGPPSGRDRRKMIAVFTVRRS